MTSSLFPLSRSLRFSVVDGVFHAAMVGASESFLGALAVELGHRGTALAILSTLPIAIGSVAQLLAPKLARFVNGNERFVVVGATIQAISHLGLIAIALTGTQSFWALLVIKTIFWTTGAMIGPGWGAWMLHLTHEIDRGRYIAMRTSVVHVALLISFILAGLFLDGDRDLFLYKAALLYVCAAVFRFLSAYALSQHAAMPAASTVSKTEKVSSNAILVPLFLAAVALTVNMTSPFFTPYMLGELALSYRTFTIVLAAAIFGRACIAPFLGDVAARIGLRIPLIVGAIGIAATPGAWALTTSTWALVFIQIASGTAWACYEFASFQLLLNTTGNSGAVRFLSKASFLSTSAGVLGAIIGGQMLDVFAMSMQDLFWVGSFVRTVPVALIIVYVAVRRLDVHNIVVTFARLGTVRPGAGALSSSIVPSSVDDVESPSKTRRSIRE